MAEEMESDPGRIRSRRVPVDLPGNSKRLKAARTPAPKPERQKEEKIVVGEVVQRKKRMGRRFTEAFFGEETIEEAVKAAITEILVSTLKSMLSDTIGQFTNSLRDGSDKFLYGTTRRTVGTTRGAYVSYNKVRGTSPAYNQIGRAARASHDFGEVILASRGEAEDVLDRMRELIAQFDVVTVEEFYDLVDITANFTDEKYGWDDLRHALVRHVRGGYMIDLPRPQPIAFD